MDWMQLINVVLGSGAVFAIGTAIRDFTVARRRRRESVRHLAVRLSLLFEAYALSCLHSLSDDAIYSNSEGHAGQPLGGIPALTELPSSDAYQLLSVEDLHDVMEFPQRVLAGQNAADFWWDTVGDQECQHNAVRKGTLKLARRAEQIASRLRRSHGLGARLVELGDRERALAEVLSENGDD